MLLLPVLGSTAKPSISEIVTHPCRRSVHACVSTQLQNCRDIFPDSNIPVAKQLIPIKKSYPYSRLPRLWIATRYDATRGGVGLLFVSKDPGFKVVVWLRPRNLSLAFCGVVKHTHASSTATPEGLAIYSCCKPPTNFPARTSRSSGQAPSSTAAAHPDTFEERRSCGRGGSARTEP